MSEYLAPGVYVEEIPIHSHAIDGVLLTNVETTLPCRIPECRVVRPISKYRPSAESAGAANIRAVRAQLILPAKKLGALRKISACLRNCRPRPITLFTGPNRTGKLLAAQVLARELQLPLYRIDLSALSNKYIGETEKNLNRLFDAAEDGGPILFFEEADALFEERTSIKDSHDRYANIGIARLLRWIEDFDGVVLLSTKRKQKLDLALLRRFQSPLTFPPMYTVRPTNSGRTRPSAAAMGAQFRCRSC